MNVDRLPPVLFRRLKRPLWLLARRLAGQRLQAYVHYRDLSRYGGVFDAPTEKVAPRLPQGFEPIEAHPGVAEVHVFALDYRDIDWLAPYRELAVIVPARLRMPDGRVEEGQCVLELPVTTEEARWTGVDNYGFPKIVADIRIDAADGGRTCTVAHAGQQVLALSMGSLPLADSAIHDRNFTVRGDGVVVASRFDLEGKIGRSSTAGTARLELGYHAIADQLRELGVRLDSGRSLYAPALHGVLSPGEELGRLSELARPAPQPAREAIEAIGEEERWIAATD